MWEAQLGLFDPRKRLSANSILHLDFHIGFERGAESDHAFLTAHPDTHFVVAPFPIHAAAPGRKSFHTYRHVEPFLRDTGANDERWFLARFVEVGEHIELEQQHLGGGPVMRCDVWRRDSAPRLFPAMERVLFAPAF